MKASPKSILAISLVALALAPCARAQEASADATKTKLKQMEDAWSKAILDKDATAVGGMVAEDYAGVNEKGVHQNKSQLLDEMKSSTDKLTASTNDEMDVHVFGPNVATVCGKSTEKGTDKHGKTFTRSYGWVDTFMEREGKWECIGEAVTLLPQKK
jgi:ketosteroid isomerase-like protein